MIIVHDIFVCKPGNASKLAKLFKEWAELEKGRGQDITIMTDMTGQWHRVVVVSEYENLADYEKELENMTYDPKIEEEEKLLEEENKRLREMVERIKR